MNRPPSTGAAGFVKYIITVFQQRSNGFIRFFFLAVKYIIFLAQMQFPFVNSLVFYAGCSFLKRGFMQETGPQIFCGPVLRDSVSGKGCFSGLLRIKAG
jgi:hypothetical protein